MAVFCRLVNILERPEIAAENVLSKNNLRVIHFSSIEVTVDKMAVLASSKADFKVLYIAPPTVDATLEIRLKELVIAENTVEKFSIRNSFNFSNAIWAMTPAVSAASFISSQ
jgi:hypothetical protein